jgi:steroid 5-alpha reductase family enzyme
MSELLSFESTIIAGIPSLMLPLLLIGLIISSLGFLRVVWFISIGYGFSVALMSTAILVKSLGIDVSGLAAFLLYLHTFVIIIYGIRLGVFLALRDASQSYKSAAKENQEKNSRVSFIAKIGIWLSVSILYIAMISPLVYHGRAIAAEGNANVIAVLVTIVGIGISIAGLVIESIADRQKTVFKRKNPGKFCNTGLYSRVRFPNYFGEMLIWTGSWIAGIAFYSHWTHWIISLAGVVVILLIMVGSASRLETSQKDRYGKIPAFIEYTKTVPALFPFIPLYSLENVKIAIR